MENNYLPFNAKIIDIKDENWNTKSFLIDLPDEYRNREILPGQFFEVSLLSQGEAPISVSQVIKEKNNLLMCIAKVGTLTDSMHSLKTGDYIGIRGPFGNGFPMDKFNGNNLILLCGGIGLAPLRATLYHYLNNYKNYEKLELLYGAKSSNDLIYKNELNDWKQDDKLSIKVSIDKPEKEWKGNVGFVTSFLDSTYNEKSNILFNLDKEFKKTKILICGPTPMVNASIKALNIIQFPDQDVYITLENRMKCGIGKCGHCNIGHKYVCTDGPVFSLKELKSLPREF